MEAAIVNSVKEPAERLKSLFPVAEDDCLLGHVDGQDPMSMAVVYAPSRPGLAPRWWPVELLDDGQQI